MQSAKNLRSLVGPVVGWPVPEPWLVPHGLPLSAYRMVVLMPLVLTVIQDDLLVAAFVRDHFPGLVRVASPSMEPQASLMAPPFQPHAQPQPQPEPPPHASPCLPALHPDWPCTSGSLMHSISSALTLPSAQRWMSRSYNSLQFLGSCVLNLVVCRCDKGEVGDGERSGWWWKDCWRCSEMLGYPRVAGETVSDDSASSYPPPPVQQWPTVVKVLMRQ